MLNIIEQYDTRNLEAGHNIVTDWLNRLLFCTFDNGITVRNVTLWAYILVISSK